MYVETDPHAREYAAAASALNDQTPSTAMRLPSVGDFVSGCSAGKRWSGYVQQIEPSRMVVEASGAWLVVNPADITH
jgi:hypothetical protein